MEQYKSYKKLIVWRKSVELVKLIYMLTKDFPKHEQYGLTSQMRRAAISIPSNIAEGFGRKSQKECGQFYSISYGSALELETPLILCRELKIGPIRKVSKVELLLTEVIKMLYTLVYKR